MPTCSHGRGTHRRRSYSGGGLGRSWRRFLPVRASLWGSRDGGGSLGLRSGRSTRLVQTPGRDWTSPDRGIKERLSFKYRLGLFGGELYGWGWLEKGVKNSQSQHFLIAHWAPITLSKTVSASWVSPHQSPMRAVLLSLLDGWEIWAQEYMEFP